MFGYGGNVTEGSFRGIHHTPEGELKAIEGADWLIGSVRQARYWGEGRKDRKEAIIQGLGAYVRSAGEKSFLDLDSKGTSPATLTYYPPPSIKGTREEETELQNRKYKLSIEDPAEFSDWLDFSRPYLSNPTNLEGNLEKVLGNTQRAKSHSKVIVQIEQAFAKSTAAKVSPPPASRFSPVVAKKGTLGISPKLPVVPKVANTGSTVGGITGGNVGGFVGGSTAFECSIYIQNSTGPGLSWGKGSWVSLGDRINGNRPNLAYPEIKFVEFDDKNPSTNVTLYVYDTNKNKLIEKEVFDDAKYLNNLDLTQFHSVRDKSGMFVTSSIELECILTHQVRYFWFRPEEEIEKDSDPLATKFFSTF